MLNRPGKRASRRYDTFKSAQTICDSRQPAAGSSQVKSEQVQPRSKTQTQTQTQSQAPSVEATKKRVQRTTGAWQVDEGKSRCRNGGVADDLIVKYINQDIETFHLARNSQVLSGVQMHNCTSNVGVGVGDRRHGVSQKPSRADS